MAKGEGFDGAEALRILARPPFCSNFGRNYPKILISEGWGVSDPHIHLPPWPRPLESG